MGSNAQKTCEWWGMLLSAAVAAQGAGDTWPLSREECWQLPAGCVASGKSPNLSVPPYSSLHVGLMRPTVRPSCLSFLVCAKGNEGWAGLGAGARTRPRGGRHGDAVTA